MCSFPCGRALPGNDVFGDGICLDLVLQVEFLPNRAGAHEGVAKRALVGAGARIFFLREEDGVVDHFTYRATEGVAGLHACMVVQAFCGLLRRFWIYVEFHAYLAC